MSQINYEEEVKKVYPDAWCDDFLCYAVYLNKDALWFIGVSHDLEEGKAWESAYNELVKQGKI